jgi:hypothetical protein
LEEPLGRVTPRPGGGARLVAGPIQRMLLGQLVDRLEARIDAEDPSTRRLFPPAYPDDADAEADYRSMARGELLDGRREAIQTVRSTLDAEDLDPAQTAAWLAVLNDLRLVVGTQIDVKQDLDQMPDEDDPRHQGFVEYMFLGWLVEQFVEVALQGLDTEPPAAS